MLSVVDFLEKMGSEAHWRYASQDDIETALVEAGIEASMCAAILAKNAADVQALLGRVKMMPQQTPTPTPEPHEVPRPAPSPDEQEDEQPGRDTPANSKPSNGACGISSLSPHYSL